LLFCNKGPTSVGPQSAERKAAPAKLQPGKNQGSDSSRSPIFYCSATHQNGEIVNHCKEFRFQKDSQFKAGSAAVFRIIFVLAEPQFAA
jgi:hypothetical protein